MTPEFLVSSNLSSLAKYLGHSPSERYSDRIYEALYYAILSGVVALSGISAYGTELRV